MEGQAEGRGRAAECEMYDIIGESRGNRQKQTCATCVCDGTSVGCCSSVRLSGKEPGYRHGLRP